MLLQTIHWESNCSKENIRVLIVMTFPGHAYQYLDLSVVAVTKQYKHPLMKMREDIKLDNGKN
jgi:hypothetical protein